MTADLSEQAPQRKRPSPGRKYTTPRESSNCPAQLRYTTIVHIIPAKRLVAQQRTHESVYRFSLAAVDSRTGNKQGEGGRTYGH